MSADLTVKHPELVDHASRIAAIGDRVRSTAAAGRAVRPGLDAYGKLCTAVPQVLDALQDILTGGVASDAETLADAAVRLRATADAYAAADDRRSAAFAAIGGRT